MEQLIPVGEVVKPQYVPQLLKAVNGLKNTLPGLTGISFLQMEEVVTRSRSVRHFFNWKNLIPIALNFQHIPTNLF
jgi:hypothetical protein